MATISGKNRRSEMMKVVICQRYGPPEVLRIAEAEKPVPKDDEVLIRVRATTVTVADFRIRSFTIPAGYWLPARLALGITKPRKPVLGVELAGEVESVGKNVKRFREGDQVYAETLMGMGAYAEYKCIRENGHIAFKPSNLSFEEAAAVPVGARTAFYYLKKGGITRGKKVLIYGASGSVGTYAVQLSKHEGAEVTAVCSGRNAELMKSLGADKTADYTEADFTSKLEKYDIILVAVDKFPFFVCNRFLKDDGVYLNVTRPLKSPRMLWVSATTKKKIVIGEDPAKSPEGIAVLTELVEKGAFKPVIDRSYTLDQIVEAHRYVDKGHKKGNVVITVNP